MVRKHEHPILGLIDVRLRLSEVLKEKGEDLKIKNMRALADKLKIDHQTVLYWNQGRTLPRLVMFLCLLAILKVDIGELVESKRDSP